jgi:sec-independent protein translocase protein TatA
MYRYLGMLNAALQIVGTEWIWIVFLVIFLLFGSKKLPELSRALGKAMGEFQRGREEIEREFRTAAATPKYTPPKIDHLNTGSEKSVVEKVPTPPQATVESSVEEDTSAGSKSSEEKE